MKSKAAQVEADYNTAKLQAERDTKLAKDGLVSDIDAKISAQKAAQLKAQLAIEKQRLSIYSQGDEAQLAAAQGEGGPVEGRVRAEEEPGGPVEGAGRFRRHAASAAAAVDAGGRRPEGDGRDGSRQGRPADAPQGGIEDRRNASKRYRHRAARGHRYASCGRRIERFDQRHGVAHRSFDPEWHGDRGCGAEGQVARRRRVPI